MGLLAFVLLAFAIGVVAGLRSLTAPMVVSWAACFGWLHVHHTWAGFMGHLVLAIILTLAAIGELVNDQNPKIPSRTAPPLFAFRLLMGGFSGAVLAAGVGQLWLAGIVFGLIGAVAGTIGGYDARTGLVRSLKVPDLAIAVPEDILAVGGGFLLMWLVPH